MILGQKLSHNLGYYTTESLLRQGTASVIQENMQITNWLLMSSNQIK